MDFFAIAFIILPSFPYSVCRPGVSIKTNWRSPSVKIPRIWFRVVCGTGLTILTFSSRIRFINEDFPAFAQPTMATIPLRKPACGAFSGESIISFVSIARLLPRTWKTRRSENVFKFPGGLSGMPPILQTQAGLFHQLNAYIKTICSCRGGEYQRDYTRRISNEVGGRRPPVNQVGG